MWAEVGQGQARQGLAAAQTGKLGVGSRLDQARPQHLMVSAKTGGRPCQTGLEQPPARSGAGNVLGSGFQGTPLLGAFPTGEGEGWRWNRLNMAAAPLSMHVGWFCGCARLG